MRWLATGEAVGCPAGYLHKQHNKKDANKVFIFILVCRSMVDLAFVIDGSGSIEHYGRGNFKRCLRFVQRVVRQFKINSGRTRIGIVLYSTRPRLMFRFSKYYRRKRQLLSAINRIPYPKGLTKTGWAMRYSYSTLFRYARRRARKVKALNKIVDLGKKLS